MRSEVGMTVQQPRRLTSLWRRVVRLGQLNLHGARPVAGKEAARRVKDLWLVALNIRLESRKRHAGEPRRNRGPCLLLERAP